MITYRQHTLSLRCMSLYGYRWLH